MLRQGRRSYVLQVGSWECPFERFDLYTSEAPLFLTTFLNVY